MIDAFGVAFVDLILDFCYSLFFVVVVAKLVSMFLALPVGYFCKNRLVWVVSLWTIFVLLYIRDAWSLFFIIFGGLSGGF